MDDTIADELFNRDLFFLKQATMRMQLRSEADWDVFDPEMQARLFECREPDTGMLKKVARGKSFNVTLSAPGGQLLRFQSDPAFFTGSTNTLLVSDGKDRPLGVLKRKSWSLSLLGKSYRFFAPGSKTPLFELKYRSKLRHYAISVNGTPAAEVRRSWKGEHATYFKNGFKQAIVLFPDLPDDALTRRVVLGLCLCMNHVLK